MRCSLTSKRQPPCALGLRPPPCRPPCTPFWSHPARANSLRPRPPSHPLSLFPPSFDSPPLIATWYGHTHPPTPLCLPKAKATHAVCADSLIMDSLCTAPPLCAVLCPSKGAHPLVPRPILSSAGSRRGGGNAARRCCALFYPQCTPSVNTTYYAAGRPVQGAVSSRSSQINKQLNHMQSHQKRNNLLSRATDKTRVNCAAIAHSHHAARSVPIRQESAPPCLAARRCMAASNCRSRFSEAASAAALPFNDASALLCRSCAAASCCRRVATCCCSAAACSRARWSAGCCCCWGGGGAWACRCRRASSSCRA